MIKQPRSKSVMAQIHLFPEKVKKKLPGGSTPRNEVARILSLQE